MIMPDLKLLSELLLFTNGFDKSSDLAKRICQCLDNIKFMTGNSQYINLSINTVKLIVTESLILFNKTLNEKQRLDWRYEYWTIKQAII